MKRYSQLATWLGGLGFLFWRWRLPRRPWARGCWSWSIRRTRFRCRGRSFARSRRRPRCRTRSRNCDYQAKIVDQVAQVQVSQSFVNTGSRQMEVSFVFPLPYDGAIDRLTFMVDGKEYRRQAAAGQGGPRASTKATSAGTRTRPCWNGSARACSRRASSRSRREPSGRSRSDSASCCGRTSSSPISCSRCRRPSTRRSRSRSCRFECRDRDDRPRSRTSTARRTPIDVKRPDDKHADRQVRSDEHDPDERLPPVLRRGRGQARRERDQLSARQRATTATSCCWPARRSKPTTTSGRPRR